MSAASWTALAIAVLVPFFLLPGLFAGCHRDTNEK